MKNIQFLLVFSCVFFSTSFISAQYPTIPKEVQAVSDSMMAGFRLASDSAWAVALPIIEKSQQPQGTRFASLERCRWYQQYGYECQRTDVGFVPHGGW